MSVESKIFYRRRLPHYQLDNATYFVTCRLYGSLPKSRIEFLLEEQKARELEIVCLKDKTKRKILMYESNKKHFSKFDEWLTTRTAGPYWMKDDRISQVIADALQYRDGQVFDLICYCIMPNHIHIVFEIGHDVLQPKDNLSIILKRDSIPLYKIMHSFKRYTAYKCNRILNRNGSFWQAESYDHVVRDPNELDRIIIYH
jgi:REP element-mobilizing transposase RayT/phage anti-repressor protein